MNVGYTKFFVFVILENLARRLSATAEANAGLQRLSIGGKRCEPVDCESADVCSMVAGVKALDLRLA